MAKQLKDPLAQEKPIDRGHCAPPSGGYLLSGSGTWAFDGPGVKVVMMLGQRLVKGGETRQFPGENSWGK